MHVKKRDFKPAVREIQKAFLEQNANTWSKKEVPTLVGNGRRLHPRIGTTAPSTTQSRHVAA
jgi:hypothetical protein